jgi:hypothetical protein
MFAAVHESAFGTKRTGKRCRLMSAFGGKADIAILINKFFLVWAFL